MVCRIRQVRQREDARHAHALLQREDALQHAVHAQPHGAHTATLPVAHQPDVPAHRRRRRDRLDARALRQGERAIHERLLRQRPRADGSQRHGHPTREAAARRSRDAHLAEEEERGAVAAQRAEARLADAVLRQHHQRRLLRRDEQHLAAVRGEHQALRQHAGGGEQ